MNDLRRRPDRQTAATPRPGRVAARPKQDPEPLFFETMPYAVGSHFVYRDDVTPQQQTGDANETDPSASARKVLLYSLLTVTALAIILGLGFAAGINLLNDSLKTGELHHITT